MGDLSQPYDVAKRNSKVDLASALRGSISFGRFLSESLDWEKWSTFSHNKHLEEAKNCSVPGSVAQMKAYFEAHYRRSAAPKLAAEQEPIDDMKNIGFSCTKAEDEEPKIDDSCTKVKSEEQKNLVHFKTPYKFGKNHRLEKMKGDKSSPATGVGLDGKHSLKIQSSSRFQKNESKAIGFSCTKAKNEEPKVDDPCTKVKSEEQKNQLHLKNPYKFGENYGLEKMKGDKSSLATGVGFDGKHSLKIQSSSRFQNNESKAIAHDSDCKKPDKKEMKDVSSISHQNENQNKKKSTNYIIKSVNIHEEFGISSSSVSKIQKFMSKENKPPQNRMEISLRSSDRSKPVSGALHMTISSNSIQKGQKSSLINKISLFYEKVGDSKAACSSSRPLECTSSKASELHHSHIRTPARTSSNGPKNAFSTPQHEYKRTQTPLYETSSAGRNVDAKICPLSINCFESTSARENRRLFDRSVSSDSITSKKIPVTKTVSPNMARSKTKSSAETPLLRSSSKRNNTRLTNVLRVRIPNK